MNMDSEDDHEDYPWADFFMASSNPWNMLSWIFNKPQKLKNSDCKGLVFRTQSSIYTQTK
jgi:hypothetical protein